VRNGGNLAYATFLFMFAYVGVCKLLRRAFKNGLVGERLEGGNWRWKKIVRYEEVKEDKTIYEL
jgi:hypothetical protein